MTGLLLKSLWFPADSRLAEVNPGAVFQLIAARGEPSALDIYDDRTIVGNLSVLAIPLRQADSILTRVKLNGQINLGNALLKGTRLDLNCQMEIDHGGGFQSYHLTLSTSRPKLSLVLSQAGPQAAPLMILKKDERVLLDSGNVEAGRSESNSLITLLLGTLGISPGEFLAIQADAEARASGVKIEARQGKFELAGTTRQGFVLKMGIPGKPGFRLCVENTGEIVLLETPVSYRLVTESVRLESPPTR